MLRAPARSASVLLAIAALEAYKAAAIAARRLRVRASFTALGVRWGQNPPCNTNPPTVGASATEVSVLPLFALAESVPCESAR